MNFEWTDERVALLGKLWADGLSASQIAKQFGGISRNAVIGKLHRCKLLGTRAKASKPVAQPIAAVVKLERRAFSEPAPFRIRSDGAMISAPPTVPLPETAVKMATVGRPLIGRPFNTCAFPVAGEGADTLACCAGVVPTRPYCPTHCAVAYQPAKPKRKRKPVPLRTNTPERWAA